MTSISEHPLESRVIASAMTSNAVDVTVYSGMDNGNISAMQLSGGEVKYSSISLHNSFAVTSIAVDPSATSVKIALKLGLVVAHRFFQ